MTAPGTTTITLDDLRALRDLGRAHEAALNQAGESLTVAQAAALGRLDEAVEQDTSSVGYRPAARYEDGELVLPAVMGEPYFDPAERYTAALIVSYDADDADGPADAANLALGLVFDGGCAHTVWKVVDHQTGEVSRFEQGDVLDDRYGAGVAGVGAVEAMGEHLSDAARRCAPLIEADQGRPAGSERWRRQVEAQRTRRDERLTVLEGAVAGLVERVDGIGSSVELQSQSLSIEDGRVRARRGEVDGFSGRLAALDRRVDEGLDALTMNAASHEQLQELRATVQDLAHRIIDGDLAERLADLERLSRLRGPR